jgi:hypothetical protein
MPQAKPKIDALFLAQYREHAASCFHRVGTTRIIDGCLPDGPPMHGCDVGEVLHRLATRQRDPVKQDCMLAMMR